MKAVATLLFALAASTASGAYAQALNQISYQAIMSSPVGTWADYVMTKDGESDKVQVRYTLVQRDAKHTVLEIDSKTPIGRMLMRLDFAPAGARWKLSKAKMRVGDGEPHDMPLPSDDEGGSFGKDDNFGDKVGRETIDTPTGKHSAMHYRRQTTAPSLARPDQHESWTTEVWMDDKLSPVGLVKLTDGQGSKVELSGTGAGGKSQM